jgi:hypothetical protein
MCLDVIEQRWLAGWIRSSLSDPFQIYIICIEKHYLHWSYIVSNSCNDHKQNKSHSIYDQCNYLQPPSLWVQLKGWFDPHCMHDEWRIMCVPIIPYASGFNENKQSMPYLSIVWARSQRSLLDFYAIHHSFHNMIQALIGPYSPSLEIGYFLLLKCKPMLPLMAE